MYYIVSVNENIMALPEKALLDTICLRRRIPFNDELELDKISKDKLLALAGPFPAAVKKQLENLLR